MITLDPHDGDFGISDWVDCHQCSRPGRGLGWFAIRAGEHHWYDRAHFHHLHHECGLALVDAGVAVIRDLPMVKAAS